MQGFYKTIKGKKDSQAIRRGVQLLSLFIVCFIGIRFSQFAGALEKGMIPLIERPPGVEVFLPISALVSLKYFFLTGIINDIHPSGLILFVIIIATAFIVKKGFCSWICPFGMFSEYLSKIHYMIFKQGIKPPAWLDRVLRSIKYLLASFFIGSIFFKMPLRAIEGFIQSPYNILADIKMFKFFTEISMTTFIVTVGVVVISVFIRNFWCRYLCPYGAIIGVLSFFSLGRIHFSKSHCSNCGKCEKVCPGLIPIRQGKASSSIECSACLQCVDVCPEKKALKYSILKSGFSMGGFGVALILLIMFTSGISLARMTGHWKNKITKQAYSYYMMTQGMMDKAYFDKKISKKQRMEKMIQMMENTKK